MYGDSNGFGWQMDEVVGVQIVTVPMSLALEKARHSFWLVMASLVTVFTILFSVLNVMLGTIVIKPIARISDVADRVSLGEMGIDEFDESGSDEVATLKASFNRMRRSLERAMNMIQG
jgi:HAMP domain-containing protein